jgi:hypothetical protein
MFEAVDNLATRAAKEVGSNRFTRFMKEHPLTSQVMKYAAGATLGGALSGAGVELLRH